MPDAIVSCQGGSMGVVFDEPGSHQSDPPNLKSLRLQPIFDVRSADHACTITHVCRGFSVRPTTQVFIETSRHDPLARCL